MSEVKEVNVTGGHASGWFLLYSGGYEQLDSVFVKLTPRTPIGHIPALLKREAKRRGILAQSGKVEWAEDYTIKVQVSTEQIK